MSHLARGKSAPANVYRDDPSSWLLDATDAECTALADLSTELLVPLPGRNRLVGLIALGPKPPKSPTPKPIANSCKRWPRRLASPLENAELIESLAAELDLRARVKREAEIAREVQERLFPQTYPGLPGIELAGFCRPAYSVGGDYYDFFLIPQPAGSPSPTGWRLLLVTSPANASPPLCRWQASAPACVPSPPFSSHTPLVTWQPSCSTSTALSTRHPPATATPPSSTPSSILLHVFLPMSMQASPVILRSGEVLQLQPTGTVIGLLEDVTYEQATIQLHPGGTILAFTDGIPEAMPAKEEEWGEDRMIAASQRLLSEPDCTRTARQLLECLLAETDAFTAGALSTTIFTLLIAAVA